MNNEMRRAKLVLDIQNMTDICDKMIIWRLSTELTENENINLDLVELALDVLMLSRDEIPQGMEERLLNRLIDRLI